MMSHIEPVSDQELLSYLLRETQEGRLEWGWVADHPDECYRCHAGPDLAVDVTRIYVKVHNPQKWSSGTRLLRADHQRLFALLHDTVGAIRNVLLLAKLKGDVA